MIKNLPAIWETWVQSLGSEDSLEKGIGNPLRILGLETPIEEPGRLWSMVSQRVRHDWATSTFTLKSDISGFPGGASGKEPSCQCRRQKTWIQSLGQEDPLEEGMATHSSILTCRIQWTEEPGGLQSIGSQKVGHDWSDWAWTHVRHDPVEIKFPWANQSSPRGELRGGHHAPLISGTHCPIH